MFFYRGNSDMEFRGLSSLEVDWLIKCFFFVIRVKHKCFGKNFSQRFSKNIVNGFDCFVFVLRIQSRRFQIAESCSQNCAISRLCSRDQMPFGQLLFQLSGKSGRLIQAHCTFFYEFNDDFKNVCSQGFPQLMCHFLDCFIFPLRWAASSLSSEDAEMRGAIHRLLELVDPPISTIEGNCGASDRWV